MNDGTVKLSKRSKELIGFVLPVALGRQLQHMVGSSFRVLVTDEGILFKPVKIDTYVAEPLPVWAREGT
jgi:hypothetical protein